MDHREIVELLPWYVNATLDDDERLIVERHLETCPACVQEVEEWRQLELSAIDADHTPRPRRDPVARAVAEIKEIERDPGHGRKPNRTTGDDRPPAPDAANPSQTADKAGNDPIELPKAPRPPGPPNWKKTARWLPVIPLAALLFFVFSPTLDEPVQGRLHAYQAAVDGAFEPIRQPRGGQPPQVAFAVATDEPLRIDLAVAASLDAQNAFAVIRCELGKRRGARPVAIAETAFDGERFVLTFPAGSLKPGRYTLAVYAKTASSDFQFQHEYLMSLEVR